MSYNELFTYLLSGFESTLLIVLIILVLIALCEREKKKKGRVLLDPRAALIVGVIAGVIGVYVG
jgi:hypothetical protein